LKNFGLFWKLSLGSRAFNSDMLALGIYNDHSFSFFFFYYLRPILLELFWLNDIIHLLYFDHTFLIIYRYKYKHIRFCLIYFNEYFSKYSILIIFTDKK
jgi:hypothetical protein